MSSTPANDLLVLAEQSGLLSAGERERLSQELQVQKPSTIQEAATQLVARGAVTSYQAEQLLAGRGQECVLAGRYQILEKLGEGGMGTVFKARDSKLDRTIAIKVLAARLVNSPDAVARFQREARALARFAHPGIVQAHDVDHDGPRHFLVMEYLEGIPLAQVLQDKGALSPARAADYVHQAALALAHAHDHALVHRDVKPSNLFLTSDGDVKLLDLGLARFVQDHAGDPGLTREGVGMGTPDYTAPEQFHDAHSADARSDVYALGCTLYHLVAGRVPFPGTSLSEKLQAHERREPMPLEDVCAEIPMGLALVVGRMMAKAPAARFQTMAEVAEALAPYAAGASTHSRILKRTATWHQGQLTLSGVVRKTQRFRRALIAAVTLVVAAGGVWAWMTFGRPDGSQVAGNGSPKQNGSSPPGKNGGKGPPKVVTIDNGFTVAKDGTGQFQTINEALDKVQAGMTIRVLDDATYKEVLLINRPGSQAGITLEAVHGATLLFPKCKSGIYIGNVPRVTLRGFRLRHDADILYLIVVAGRCQGLRLEGLDLRLMEGGMGGITLEGVEPGSPTSGSHLSVVENCTIQGGAAGVRVSGFSSYAVANPCGTMVLRNNTILDSLHGMTLLGALRQIHVVGNRIAFCGIAGLQLENLLPGSEEILFANNTLLECKAAFRLWEDGSKKDLGKNIRLINNLALASSGPDMLFVDSGGDPSNFKGPGNGRSLLEAWHWENNWRETAEPKGDDVFAKSWIPVADGDVRHDRIEAGSRTSRGADFLRPAADAPMAKAGKGGDFPSYVGALPPAGAAEWDWSWTWEAVVHNRITVSQDPKDGGRFRTIGKALEAVRPKMTIRVLDDATYREALSWTAPLL